ncbi:exonuclease, DNA polymerase III, epsilon subunit family [Pyrinomonas methylaliphatogenes]|jgi:DNA polymerase III epsilon subunit family exonuclease|uniref:Exonuclease, DNA polymerase III, epsilon subunit family n=2 Tax=Pyrinomonas methylaliphatogenes TaxID=454194 RepID=A0A0B6WZU2_9BACT|nr:exonuclease, DNA polymerase III, epsilon subunit family [Pyrinomonas methylaliphatogenes]
MPPYRNLIPSSELAQEMVELAHRFGGRVPATIAADQILQIRHLDARTATLLIADLLHGDPRVRMTANGEIEIIANNATHSILEATEFVVVDVETTGTRTPPCRIMEIGAYRIKDGDIVDEFHRLVNPEAPIPPFIAALTGITDALVARAPRFAEIVHDWLEFAGLSILVAHNAAFDLRFLNHEIERLFPGYRLANESLCTIKLAKRLVPGLPSYRLRSLAEHFQISITNHHRATSDAYATAQIFLRLLERARASALNPPIALST